MNSFNSAGLRLCWNRKTPQFVAISTQVMIGGYREGTAVPIGIMRDPAPAVGL